MIFFSHELLDISLAENNCLLNCIAATLYNLELKQILGSRYNTGKYKGGNYKQFYYHNNCENVCFPVGFSDIEILEKK